MRGSPIGLASCMWAAAALVGCGHAPRPVPTKVEGDVVRVEVDVDHGNVEIVASADVQQVEIVRAPRGVPDARGSKHELANGVLKIESRCGSAPGCRIHHRLRVPLHANLALKVSDGDLALIDVGGDVEADVGLGTIDGLRLTGAHVDVRTEGGNIDLIFEASPQKLVANAAAGDVTLRVPAGDYRCDVAASAVPSFGVRCDEKASRTIAAATAVGKLAVRATE